MENKTGSWLVALLLFGCVLDTTWKAVRHNLSRSSLAQAGCAKLVSGRCNRAGGDGMALSIKALFLPSATALCFIASAVVTMSLQVPGEDEHAAATPVSEPVRVATELSFPVYTKDRKVGYCVIGIDMAIAGNIAEDRDFSHAYEGLYALAGSVLQDSTDAESDCALLAERAKITYTVESWQLLQVDAGAIK
jgi:hypothetical protein